MLPNYAIWKKQNQLGDVWLLEVMGGMSKSKAQKVCDIGSTLYDV